MTDTFDQAARLGLGTHYADAFGMKVQVPESALKLIVDKLALPDLPCPLVSPCVILDEGQDVSIPLGTDKAAFWRVVQENGQEISGEIAPGTSTLSFPSHLPLGYHTLEVRQGEAACEARLIVTPARAYMPWPEDAPKRVWGVAAQVYSLRSGTNWGIGDFTDLATLVTGIGHMGGAIVGVNPLHALFPDDPERASPYSPSSRQYLNWLYLDVEAILDFRECEEAAALVASTEFQNELARLRAVPLIDYSGVAIAKKRALELAYAWFRSSHLKTGTSRARAFQAFRLAQGTPLRRFALFHAMREVLGATDWSLRDWRNWPEEYRTPEAPGVSAFVAENLERVEYHEYVQFCLFEQLDKVRDAAVRAGLDIGLYGDLAVGVDIAGAEGWSSQGIIVNGLDIGCPPDPLAPHGQNWGLPVMNPEAMKRLGYEPFVRVLRSIMQSFGALRIDHVLGLMRLYCIPTEDPLHGAYLAMPFKDLIRIVALESQRAKCIVIGEDLGNLPDGARESLMAYGILSYRVLWFEQYPDIFMPSDVYPAQSLVTISTHDLPTLAGFWAQGDINVRKSLNLMTDSQIAELREERTGAKAKLSQALATAGLLKTAETPEQIPLEEIYRFVARTPSSLMVVQLEDVLQQVEQANMPGTDTEHPNWRRKLALDLPAVLAEQSMRQLAVIAGQEGRVSRKVTLPPRNAVDPALAIPASTYRLQFSAAFTFQDAIRIIPYLAQLGISHVYASSYLKARAGSTHGYDIVDHNAINPEIGTEADFKAYLNTLNAWRMGQVLDFVPNHMGVGRADNQWWLDVLEWGQDSQFGHYFDIDWQVPDPMLRGKVMLPVLGNSFGDTVQSGDLKLLFEPLTGTFSLWYNEHRFPVRPADYADILAKANRPELAEIVTSFRDMAKPGIRKQTRRNSAASLKADLAHAITLQPDLEQALTDAAATYYGKPGDRESWTAYVRLLERQNYRLASWRLAADEINYRRFFDINDLAGIRIEDEELFELVHRMLARLMAQGALHGVRLDHIDGLHDPSEYLVRLYRYLSRFGAAHNPKARGRDKFYILVEKILATDETLRAGWPVSGTTGYEFIADTTALYVDSSAEAVFDETYRRFTGMGDSFETIALEAKHKVIRDMLPSDLSRLARRLKHVADRDWNTRDYSLSRLRLALYEVVRGFKVYRTYVSAKQVSADDRTRINQAVTFARGHWRAPDASILDFVEKTLTGDLCRDPHCQYKRQDVYAFVQAFQQYTGPVMAKSLEDTAFYRYYRLVSLNEVGNDPSRFGLAIADFHATNAARAKASPNSMLGSSTHDTKRGEDTRARISVLSELGAEWPKLLDQLHKAGDKVRTGIGPNRNDEYMIYQTALGIWPPKSGGGGEPWKDVVERLKQYFTKAVREGKLMSSWTDPNEEYEQQCLDFIEGLTKDQAFIDVAKPLAALVAKFGYINSLSQLVLKLTAPGVSDVYQGSELWNFSLADPDNRRPVDYDARLRLLEQSPLLPEILRDLTGPAQMEDGAIKLRLVQRLLKLRRKAQELFETGNYTPVEVTGAGADNIIAYTREAGTMRLFVACGRFMTRMEVPGTALDAYAWDWKDTKLAIPDGDWQDMLNAGKHQGGCVEAAQVFGAVPVAVWVSGK